MPTIYISVKGGETPSRPTEFEVFRLLAGHIREYRSIFVPYYEIKNKELILRALLSLVGIQYKPDELEDKRDFQLRQIAERLDNRGRGMGWKLEGNEPKLKKTRDPEKIAFEMNRHGSIGFLVTSDMVLDAQMYRLTNKLPRELKSA